MTTNSRCRAGRGGANVNAAARPHGPDVNAAARPRCYNHGVRLLEPIEVGGRKVANRVVFGPHETNLGDARALSERHVAYYERRARGGAGVVVTEVASVHELDWPYERAPLAAGCEPGWAAVAAACQRAGATVVAGLGHAGMQGSSAYSQRELWAPSRVPHAVSRELPKEMEGADVEAVVGGFGAAAAAAMASGMDGVEINAGQHSLLRQFLSGLTNQRADEWGIGPEGLRIGFAVAVLAQVRAAVGAGAIVGLRLSCDELAPWAGLTPEAAAAVAGALAPHVDYLVVVRGSIYSAEATRPDTHAPAGFNLDLAGAIRAAVQATSPTTAVVAQGSVVDWGQAEWALSDGRADMVEMTRAQIADPDLVAKLRAGAPERIRPCLRCNQRCQVRDARNPIVTCVVNPTAGYEASEADPDDPARPAGATAASRRPVRIVGAGPAGLEAARLLARSGRPVTVLDRRSEAGGLVPVWTSASGREPLGAIVGWLVAEAERAGAELCLGTEVSAADVARWEAAGDEVLVCTGSTTRPPEYEVAAGVAVLDAADLLDGAARPDGPVVIWDPIGGPIAVSVAETLVAAASVTLVTPDPIVGTMLALTGDLAPANTRLLQRGVTLLKQHRLMAVTATGAVVDNVVTGARQTIPAACVIDCGHRLPAPLVPTGSDPVGTSVILEGSDPVGTSAAGDVVAPRTIYEAILEGRRFAAGR